MALKGEDDLLPSNWRELKLTLDVFDVDILHIVSEVYDRWPEAFVNVSKGRRFFNHCGFRVTPTVGAARSAHLEGKAVDFHYPSKEGLAQIRAWVMSEDGRHHGIKRVEDERDSRTWVHVDVREPISPLWKNKALPYVFRV